MSHPDDPNLPADGDDPPVTRVMLPTLETPTLTKAELAELLFERLGLNKRESKDMVEAFFDIIQAALITGRDVKMLKVYPGRKVVKEKMAKA